MRFKKLSLVLILTLMLWHSMAFSLDRPEVIVFVSFSMPEESIRTWMKEATLYDASMNIRGLIQNNLPLTMSTIQKLIRENNNQGGINIDPEVFEAFQIKKVPAVVVRQSGKPNNDFDVIYGTSSIKEALQVMQKAV